MYSPEHDAKIIVFVFAHNVIFPLSFAFCVLFDINQFISQ
jgi:hypothetical protein